MYTTIEASTILDIQPKTVTRYILRGLIHAEKRGRDYLISDEDLARFQRERRSVGKPVSGRKMMDKAVEQYSHQTAERYGELLSIVQGYYELFATTKYKSQSSRMWHGRAEELQARAKSFIELEVN